MSGFQRVAEPELMLDPEQARAYAAADFSEPHDRFVELFAERFADQVPREAFFALELGCGAGDVCLRFARAFPRAVVHGIDGSEAMLACGRDAVACAGLGDRVELVHGYLPRDAPPRERYDAVFSNSLLHHLADPSVLWASVRRFARPGAPVLVMDLLRPASRAEVDQLVERYAAGEAPFLQRDFCASLCAAYRPEEVRDQLERAGLPEFRVEASSDRHFIVHGRAPA